MSDKSNFGSFLMGFTVGALAGAIVSLLMAPQTGDETRQIIKEKTIELKDKGTETYEDTKHRAEVAYKDALAKADELAKVAKEKASELGHSTKTKVEKLAEEATTAAEEVAKVTKEKASELGHSTKIKAEKLADETTKAAGDVASAAHD